MTIYDKLLSITGSLLLVTTLSLSASPVSKADQTTPAQTGISPKEIVKKSYNFLGSLKGYAYKATIVNEDDYKDHMMLFLTHHYEVAVQRPDKVRMDVRGDVDNYTTFMNNGKATIFNLETNKYGVIDVEDDIDDALDTLIEEYGFAIPLTQLLYSDTAEDIEEDLGEGFYFGTVLIDDKPCYYIGFPGKEWDIQLWIEKGERPLIRRAAFVDKLTKDQPRSIIKVTWITDKINDQSIFDFTPPQNAKKVEIKKLETKDTK